MNENLKTIELSEYCQISALTLLGSWPAKALLPSNGTVPAVQSSMVFSTKDTISKKYDHTFKDIFQEIYEKEFHVDLKGYAPAEVDEFLDMVIEDYQKYDEKVEELGAAVTRYEEKIKELQQQLFALQSENENLNEKVNSDFVNGSSNTVDILKRIARLEKAVFNQSEE